MRNHSIISETDCRHTIQEPNWLETVSNTLGLISQDVGSNPTGRKICFTDSSKTPLCRVLSPNKKLYGSAFLPFHSDGKPLPTASQFVYLPVWGLNRTNTTGCPCDRSLVYFSDEIFPRCVWEKKLINVMRFIPRSPSSLVIHPNYTPLLQVPPIGKRACQAERAAFRGAL